MAAVVVTLVLVADERRSTELDLTLAPARAVRILLDEAAGRAPFARTRRRRRPSHFRNAVSVLSDPALPIRLRPWPFFDLAVADRERVVTALALLDLLEHKDLPLEIASAMKLVVLGSPGHERSRIAAL